jgi:hypothetical protein
MMLGVSWIPGFFGKNEEWVQIIFDIFAGLQGFLMFLLLVVFQEDARKVLCGCMSGCMNNDNERQRNISMETLSGSASENVR